MCSVNDDNDDAKEFMVEEKISIPDSALCQKCNEEKAVILLRGKDVYCKTCFLAAATHKFRATLGKSKIVRPNDEILVAHNGAAGSTALLHLVKAGMQAAVHKRLMFETKVLYVDDGAAKNEDLEERRSRINEISKQIDYLGFESYGATLSQSLNEEQSNIDKLENFSNNLDAFVNQDERLKSIFINLSDYTAKKELLRKLRKKLIFSIARNLGCNKIFVADDSTSLAIAILSNVSLGRGAQLSLDVNFVDDRHSDVTLLRPMRDFTRHELSCYLELHNLKTIDGQTPKNFGESTQSIQGLTENFVTDLDSRFHGTVSTIFRTGEKIGAGNTTKKTQNLDEICVLCEAPLDTSESQVISALQATSFSRLVSSEGPNGNLDSRIIKDGLSVDNLSLESKKTINGCGNCVEGESCGKTKEILVSRQDLNTFLCYGCRLIFKNSETIEFVPNCILNAVKQRLSLESMRHEISDFLL